MQSFSGKRLRSGYFHATINCIPKISDGQKKIKKSKSRKYKLEYSQNRNTVYASKGKPYKIWWAMRVIKRKTLQDFWEKNPLSEQPLKAWFTEAIHSTWNTPDDIKEKYGSADILPDNRVVFNIGGNKYRLIVKIAYKVQLVFIRFVGTHSEYDKINAETI